MKERRNLEMPKHREYQCNVCAAVYTKTDMSMPHSCSRDQLKITANAMFAFYKGVTIAAYADQSDAQKLETIKFEIQRARNLMAQGRIPAVQV